ncbi:MAG: TniQ family protein [Sterolibacterium sp.]|jgi:hypothetical protein
MSELIPLQVLMPEPDLLLRPAPGRAEGPQGYLLRLAEENCMSQRELKQLGVRYDPSWLTRQRLLPDSALDPGLHAHVTRMAGLLQDKGRIWNLRHARFCPLCLAEEPTWRASWEILFNDVCPHHRVWLVDQCGSCRQPIKWNREAILRCQCGSDLREESPGIAPENSRHLSSILEARLLGSEVDSDRPPLAGLDVEQVQRLIRYLGGYMDSASGPNPLKLRNAGSMQASWPVSSLAAEIVAQWPQAFHGCWTRIQEHGAGEKAGLRGLFRQAYYYLYKGLKEDAFLPVRDAFETWLGEHWKGGLCKRNRRLTAQLLDKVQWIPGKVAADQLGISIARLRSLVREGYLDGQESVSTKARRFLIVRRDQLDQINIQLANEMTMTAAMDALGIGKVRMQRLLRLLFPNARRIQNKEKMPWCVPRSDVEQLLGIENILPVVTIPEENQVSLAHVFKYWAWTAEEIVSLIESVRVREFVPAAALDSGRGIGRWIFDAGRLRAWQVSLNPGRMHWLKIPEAAKLLGVKQQVAYWLTQNGYLPVSEKLGFTDKTGARVRREDVGRFREEYVFGTEIAERLGTSSRKVARLLAEQRIHPIRGHSPDPCRQLIYVRDEGIRRFIMQMSRTSPQELQLVGTPA